MVTPAVADGGASVGRTVVVGAEPPPAHAARSSAIRAVAIARWVIVTKTPENPQFPVLWTVAGPSQEYIHTTSGRRKPLIFEGTTPGAPRPHNVRPVSRPLTLLGTLSRPPGARSAAPEGKRYAQKAVDAGSRLFLTVRRAHARLPAATAWAVTPCASRSLAPVMSAL